MSMNEMIAKGNLWVMCVLPALCMQVYPALESVATATSLSFFDDSAASPAAGPVAGTTVTLAPSPPQPADTASAASTSQSAADTAPDSDAASPMASPAAGPSMASADSITGGPAPSSALDVYKSLIESYMASMVPAFGAAAPVATPTSGEDTSPALAASLPPSVQLVSLEEDAATPPAAAPALGEGSLWAAAASPDAGTPTPSLMPDLALPLLPFLNAPGPVAPPAGRTVSPGYHACFVMLCKPLTIHQASKACQKPVG